MSKAAGQRRGKCKVLSQREIDKAFETHWNRNKQSVVSKQRKRSQKKPDGSRGSGRKAAT